jgi:hypothetical protein
MKRMIVIMALLQVGVQYCEFTLQTIENRSDLKFKDAYYKQSGKEKKLPALMDALQKSNNKQHVVIDKKVGSAGLALAMADQEGHHATIFIHDQAQHSIEYKRNKIKQIAQFPEIVSTGTGPYSAQIMMKDTVDGKMVADSKSYNHEENTEFNLMILGSGGNYQVSLHPTA